MHLVLNAAFASLVLPPMPFCIKMICVYVSVCTWGQPGRKSSLTLIQFSFCIWLPFHPLRKLASWCNIREWALLFLTDAADPEEISSDSREIKKKKKRERGSTSRTAWGSIYKRADKLSDFKKGSGLIKQPIVDAKQLRRSAFPVIGSKRLSWCVRSAGQRQQTGSMSCESAELFDSTGLRDLKRRLGLLCAMQRFCRWHRVVAACLQRKLLGPLALWPGDNNSDGSSTRRICTSFPLKILAALPHSRGAHQLQKTALH